jgi:hypothetical protein
MKRFRIRRTFGLGTALAAILVAGLATPAAADTGATSLELLQRCDSADYCVFHVGGAAQVYWSTTEMVGQTANCTHTAQTASIAWTKSTFSTNSVGGSWKFIAGATKAFMAGFKVTYQHDWTDTKTDSDTTTLTIPAGYLGTVSHARQMERVTGTYELHFGKRFYGHYFWYVPFTMNSPKGDGKDDVTTKSTRMTPQEHSAFCR